MFDVGRSFLISNYWRIDQYEQLEDAVEPKITFPDFHIKGQNALVTGASRGIGRALALGLAHAGATVALTGRNKETLGRVAEEIDLSGGGALVQPMDVTDMDSIRRGIDACVDRMEGLDILVNNAGFESVSDSFEVTSDLWDTILNTNLKGAFFCAQAAAKTMSEAGRPPSINPLSCPKTALFLLKFVF